MGCIIKFGKFEFFFQRDSWGYILLIYLYIFLKPLEWSDIIIHGRCCQIIPSYFNLTS